MRIVQTHDLRPVAAILRHPFIAGALAYDGRTMEPIDHLLVSYHLVYDGAQVVGVFTAFQQTKWEVEVHAAFLPEGRRLSRIAGAAWLDRLFAAPDLARATAYVLGSRPSAANYCRRLGFVDEGRRREAVRVGGEAVDILVLGMTRGDWLSARSPGCSAFNFIDAVNPDPGILADNASVDCDVETKQVSGLADHLSGIRGTCRAKRES